MNNIQIDTIGLMLDRRSTHFRNNLNLKLYGGKDHYKKLFKLFPAINESLFSMSHFRKNASYNFGAGVLVFCGKTNNLYLTFQ